MKFKFNYIFENHGTTIDKEVDENTVWIDIGGKLKMGMFDHHQHSRTKASDPSDSGAEYCSSSFSCILNNPCFLEKLFLYCRNNRENIEINIHTHKVPDLDNTASIFLLQRMLETGNLNSDDPEETLKTAFGNIGVLDRLREYIDGIDGGHKKYVSRLTLYTYFQCISEKNRIDKYNANNLKILEDGVRLIELVFSALKSDTGNRIDLFEDVISSYLPTDRLDPDYFRSAREQVQRISSAYDEDKRNGNVEIKTISVWQKRKSDSLRPLDEENNIFIPTKKVKAAIWKKLPAADNEYCVAREQDKCMLTVYPRSIRLTTTLDIPVRSDGNAQGKSEASADNPDQTLTQVIIALNPDLDGYRDLTLLPLAEVLEQCEQSEEERYFMRYHCYRRDHSHSRDREDGRFSKAPFSETADPWYISEKGDIIDVPGVFSLISYDQILNIIENSCAMAAEVRVFHFRNTDGYMENGVYKENTGSSAAASNSVTERGNTFSFENAGNGVVSCNEYFSLEKADKADIRGNEKPARETAPKKYMKNISFGTLYEKIQSRIGTKHSGYKQAVRSADDGKASPEDCHLFIAVKIDPAMIKYSNSFLSSCCLNIVGKSRSEASDDNLMYIDYRTCMYTDHSVTVLAADTGSRAFDRLMSTACQCMASSENNTETDKYDNKNHVQTYPIICSDIRKNLEHKLALQYIGKELPDIIHRLKLYATGAKGISRENAEAFSSDSMYNMIRSLNEKLVRLNSNIQRDAIIIDPLEQEVYSFINQVHGINSLKDSVITSAQFIIKDYEQLHDR
ncbi:MAG: hypothetical protein PUC98_01330, partial [Clostridiales bacterium]|nr:hypothetical protein [Clostridiales bacterium]